MKSQKETKILLFLLLVLLVYGFYSYLLKPKMDANAELREDIDAEEREVMAMYAVAAGYSANVDAVNEHKKTLQKQSERFYSQDRQQEEFINILHELLVSDELKLVSIGSTDYARTIGDEYPDSVSPYVVYFAEGDTASMGYSLQNMLEGDTAGKYPHADRMEITFEYTGEYENIHKFFEKLDQTECFTTSFNLEISLNDKRTVDTTWSSSGGGGGFTRYTESETKTEEIPESEMTVTISFIRLKSLGALQIEVEEINTADCVMPAKLANGSYREMYTFDNFIRAVKGVFGGE